MQVKKLWLLFFSLLACQLVAEDYLVAWGTKKPVKSTGINTCDQPCNTTPQHPPKDCAYNAPSLLNRHASANLYVTGSYLSWRASADYLAYAFLANPKPPNAPDIEDVLFKGKTLEPGFKYKPGYQVGVGYKIHRDSWDVYAEYTCFHQKVHTFKQVIDTAVQDMHAIWLVFVVPALLNDGFRSCSSAWTTNLDILDAEIGRNFFCGRYLTFRPSLGLRTLWLEQKYNLTYISSQDAIPAYSSNKSNSWGIGPRLALKNAWNLYGGLKILGDFGISLLHVQDHVSVKQSTPLLSLAGLSDDVSYLNKERISILKPILDLSLGLGWGLPFRHDKCAFDLQLAYDYSLYWDQASIQLGHAPIVASGGPVQVVVGNAALSTGNLSIQGLRATARLDF